MDPQRSLRGVETMTGIPCREISRTVGAQGEAEGIRAQGV